jgi:hypothetical protein
MPFSLTPVPFMAIYKGGGGHCHDLTDWDTKNQKDEMMCVRGLQSPVLWCRAEDSEVGHLGLGSHSTTLRYLASLSSDSSAVK